jgi:hypothetical protein
LTTPAAVASMTVMRLARTREPAFVTRPLRSMVAR